MCVRVREREEEGMLQTATGAERVLEMGEM